MGKTLQFGGLCGKCTVFAAKSISGENNSKTGRMQHPEIVSTEKTGDFTGEAVVRMFKIYKMKYRFLGETQKLRKCPRKY